MKIVFISFKKYEDYFRIPLIDIAEEAGTPVLYIKWGNSKTFYRRGAVDTVFTSDTPCSELSGNIREFSDGEKTYIVTSMALNNVLDIYWLRKKLHEMFWIYDVFDYFFYDASGIDLMILKLKDWINRRRINKIIVISEIIKKMYPKSIYLNSASHVTPRPGNVKPGKRAVIISSFDDRFCFDELEKIAGLLPAFEFHLYGWIKSDNKETERIMSFVTDRCSNVKYYGAYVNSDLDRILDSYDIGLLFYKQNDPLTRYINPEKIHHYLCKGLEVVATPIPQTEIMKSHLHLASNAEEFAAKLRAITEDGLFLNDGSYYKANNWKMRWLELEQILK